MGIFDDLVSLVGNATANASSTAGAPSAAPPSSLLQAAIGLMQQQGGLPQLLTQLQSNGLGSQVASWVGTGANQPVSGEQLAGALGNNTLGAIATKLGMPPTDVSSGLASLLPQVIDKMTPNGAVPDNHGDLLSQAISSFLK